MAPLAPLFPSPMEDMMSMVTSSKPADVAVVAAPTYYAYYYAGIITTY